MDVHMCECADNQFRQKPVVCSSLVSYEDFVAIVCLPYILYVWTYAFAWMNACVCTYFLYICHEWHWSLVPCMLVCVVIINKILTNFKAFIQRWHWRFRSVKGREAKHKTMEQPINEHHFLRCICFKLRHLTNYRINFGRPPCCKPLRMQGDSCSYKFHPQI